MLGNCFGRQSFWTSQMTNININYTFSSQQFFFSLCLSYSAHFLSFIHLTHSKHISSVRLPKIELIYIVFLPLQREWRCVSSAKRLTLSWSCCVFTITNCPLFLAAIKLPSFFFIISHCLPSKPNRLIISPFSMFIALWFHTINNFLDDQLTIAILNGHTAVYLHQRKRHLYSQ